MDNEKREVHESFGMLGFSRVTSSRGENLFGSAIPHRQTITMKVKRAEKIRTLYEERYFAGDQLIEVEMSPMQFAECITSLNNADGIPCTIRYVGRDRMADCPETTFRQEFEAEFKEKTQKVTHDVGQLIARVKELLGQKTIKAADRQEVLEKLSGIDADLRSNLPFIASQFNEAMDKVVTDARSSVEAFFLHRITELGIQHLKEGTSPLLIGENHENSTD